MRNYDVNRGLFSLKDVVFSQNPSRKVLDFFVLSILLFVQSTFGSPMFNKTLCNSDVCEFSNLAIDKSSGGHIYIGARNRIYELTVNLDLVATVATGPRGVSGVAMDNVNKILLVDGQQDRVIVCGSVHHGTCEMRGKNIRTLLSDSNTNDTTTRQYVAGGADQSTVAFIAPSSDPYLYVGSSKTKLDEPNLYSDDVFFTVAKRTLNPSNPKDLFSVAVYQDFYDLGILMNEDYANRDYRVEFIHSFAGAHTGYFVATHPAPDRAPHNDDVTYISQICLKSSIMLNSYMELRVECRKDGIVYRKAVAASTNRVGRGYGGDATSDVNVVMISFKQPNHRRSVVCIFPLKKIEEKFAMMVRGCQSGSPGPVPASIIPWVDQSGAQCGGSFNIDPKKEVCSHVPPDTWEVTQYLQGGSPWSEEAVYMSESSITSIEFTKIQRSDHTIVFMGTDDGNLVKFQLGARGGVGARAGYETIPIDPGFPVKWLKLGRGDNMITQPLYAMSPNTLIRLPLFNCRQHTTCAACLAAQDPFCGWCTMEAKCSSTGTCNGSNQEKSGYFQNSDTGSCPTLNSSKPLHFSASTTAPKQEVELTGMNFPSSPSYEYHCRFDTHPLPFTATTIPEPMGEGVIGINCGKPPTTVYIPNNGPGSKVIPVALTATSKQSARVVVVVSINITLYKCGLHRSCLPCVTSGFGCVWCPSENKCTDSEQDCEQLSNALKNPQVCLLLSTCV